MKNRSASLIIAFFSFLIIPGLAAGQVTKQWDVRFGGNSLDWIRTAIPTSDGGYFLAGYSLSGSSGDKTQVSQGSMDYWVVKTNGSGVKQWDYRFGGSGFDVLWKAAQTSDGGYILAGSSGSGISGDKSQASQGGDDYWIIKISSLGILQWDARYGGSGQDELTGIAQTSDGGFIIAGYSDSPISGEKTQGTQGLHDYWIVKTDANGVKLWDARYGGSAEEMLWDVQQTSDGGYILAGISASGISGDKTQAFIGGGYDYWIVKTDNTGVKQWDATFGGTQEDDLFSVKQTPDGGYILAGTSASGISGDKTQASQGGADFWVVKTNGSGTKLWDRDFGGSDDESPWSLCLTPDGGFVFGGFSNSGISGDKTQTTQGGNDYWLVRADGSGNKVWDVRFGGNAADQLYDIHLLVDGSYLLGGISASAVSGDKSQSNQGDHDYWLIKTSADPLPIELRSFSAVAEGKKILLNWETGETTNLDFFEVERSGDGTRFSMIGRQSATEASLYSTVDFSPSAGTNYYRLRTTEKNGDHSYSKIVSVNIAASGQIYLLPNPAQDKLFFYASGRKIPGGEIVVTDAAGKIWITKKLSGEKAEIDIHSLAPGVYLLKAGDEVFRFEKSGG